MFWFLDSLTSVLICFTVVFSPWAFGSQQTWAKNVMTVLGGLLGALWLSKCAVRRLAGNCPRRWTAHPDFTIRCLGFTSVLLLVYCLISALNARATYLPEQWEFQYQPAVLWLPHSYDADGSWAVFWQYLGLAGLFWSLRDWLLTMTPQEVWEQTAGDESANRREPVSAGHYFLPARLRLLLWVLAVSGGLLAIQGILQRLGGSDKVLWLAKPEVVGANRFQLFGAFPYRGNASQYFNLLWPVILGFTWLEFNARKARSTDARWFGLLVASVFMAICPLIAASRAGAGVLLLNLALAATVFWRATQKFDQRSKLTIPLVAGIILVVGLFLGWSALAPRLQTLSTDAQERAALSQVGVEISADNPIFGTGPGSLASIYQIYMHEWVDMRPDHLHNDWLETLDTFGWVGSILILACLVLAVSHWFFGRGIPAGKCFVRLGWISLAGCLVHACFDWPFECHSVLTLFLVIGAILSCLSGRISLP
jgi:hypothetical protein